MKHVVLIHNKRSGDGNQLRAILDAFQAAGLEATPLAIDADVARKIREEQKRGHTTFVAAGGDGTVSAVAGALVGSSAVLGIIPVGTLNHFAKDARIPLDITEAVNTIVDGRIVKVDTALVNDVVFINNSSIGVYSHFVKEREAHEHRIGKLPAALRAGWNAFWAMKRYPVTLQAEDETIETKASFLFIGNNRYRVGQGRLASRTHLDGGKLSLYIVKTSRLGRAFEGILRLMQGKNSRRAVVPRFMVDKATVYIHSKNVFVAHDGEVTRMKAPLHYAIRPKSLHVIVPKQTS